MTSLKMLKLCYILIVISVLHFNFIYCFNCPFAYIQITDISKNVTNEFERSTCILLKCTASTHCTSTFEHSRCSYFTKQCICNYDAELDDQTQLCIPKKYSNISEQESTAILKLFPMSIAVLFIFICLLIWTKFTVDYVKKKREKKKRKNIYKSNNLQQKQQVSLLRLKNPVNLMTSLEKRQKKNLLNFYWFQHSVFTVKRFQLKTKNKKILVDI